MADKYYIYEIVGVKVGCTKNFKHRQFIQKDKGEMVVLEVHTNIEDATRREREIQLEKGYGIDGNSYAKQLKLVELARDPEVIKRRVANHDYEDIHRKGAPKRSKYYNSFREWNNKNKKKVFQYSLDNKFIKQYNSISEAGKETNIPKGNISANLNNRQKSAGGYIWRFEE